MDTVMICGPDAAKPAETGSQDAQGNDSGTDADERSQRHEHSKKANIPSESDCLCALTRLVGVVTMGLLKPAQGNTILHLLQGNPCVS